MGSRNKTVAQSASQSPPTPAAAKRQASSTYVPATPTDASGRQVEIPQDESTPRAPSDSESEDVQVY